MARFRPASPIAVAGALSLALALGGCGRRGRLEPPPDPNAPAAAAKTTNAEGVPRRPKNPPIKPPNQPFILDPML